MKTRKNLILIIAIVATVLFIAISIEYGPIIGMIGSLVIVAASIMFGQAMAKKFMNNE